MVSGVVCWCFYPLEPCLMVVVCELLVLYPWAASSFHDWNRWLLFRGVCYASSLMGVDRPGSRAGCVRVVSSLGC